jgi:hypothetical protein
MMKPPISSNVKSPRRKQPLRRAPAGAKPPIPVVATPTPQPADEPASAPEPAFTNAEAAAFSLSPAQRTAIQKMLAGHSLVASATAAGVTRITLYRWLKHDAKFQAAYNAWQQDLMSSARTRILAMTDTATTTVARAVQTDARVALTVLKSMGILDRVTIGSTDPKEIARRQKIEELRARDKAEDDAREAVATSVLTGHMSHQEGQVKLAEMLDLE